MAKRKKNIFCPNCGSAVRAADSFCASCGNKRSGKINRPRKDRKRPNWMWITGLVLVAAFTAGFIVAGMSGKEQPEVNRAHNTALIAAVASEFDCSCGNCDKTLQNCDCPTAKDTFAYISQKIRNGAYSRLEVIKMVNDRYGYLIDKSVLEG